MICYLCAHVLLHYILCRLSTLLCSCVTRFFIRVRVWMNHTKDIFVLDKSCTHLLFYYSITRFVFVQLCHVSNTRTILFHIG